jgi:hypothetical protein
VFVAVAVACAAVATASVVWAALHTTPSTSNAVAEALPAESNPPAAEPDVAAPGAPVPAVAAAPSGRLMVRAVDRDNPGLNGAVSQLGIGGSETTRTSRSLGCQRVYYASGRGLCLALTGRGVNYEVRVFDRALRTLHELPLEGIPSRARVSPGGRYGSVTSFVAGHSYAAAGAFSTRTVLVDLRSGKEIADLEQFRVTDQGRPVDSPDVNFWGVTFVGDSGRFYATLATGGHYYLIQGDIAERTARVLRDGVECPSLSPDETRIAYKSRIAEGRWRIGVIELDGMRDILLSETRSVDDQPEWLDGGWVAYGLDGDIWAVRSDGRGRPRGLVANAASPAALR